MLVRPNKLDMYDINLLSYQMRTWVFLYFSIVDNIHTFVSIFMVITTLRLLYVTYLLFIQILAWRQPSLHLYPCLTKIMISLISILVI